MWSALGSVDSIPLILHVPAPRLLLNRSALCSRSHRLLDMQRTSCPRRRKLWWLLDRKRLRIAHMPAIPRELVDGGNGCAIGGAQVALIPLLLLPLPLLAHPPSGRARKRVVVPSRVRVVAVGAQQDVGGTDTVDDEHEDQDCQGTLESMSVGSTHSRIKHTRRHA